MASCVNTTSARLHRHGALLNGLSRCDSPEIMRYVELLLKPRARYHLATRS